MEPVQHLRLATTLLSRARGLLGTVDSDLADSALLLVPCGAVHTLGMRYAIDVAFLSKDGVVMSVHRAVQPGLPKLSDRGARAVIERPARGGRWLEPGHRTAISLGD